MANENLTESETPGEAENGNLLATVDAAIGAMQKLLVTKGTEKGSLSDLIRLLQLRRELEGEKPRNIRARWVDDKCRNSTD